MKGTYFYLINFYLSVVMLFDLGYTQKFKITPNNIVGVSIFGRSIALSGNDIVVGANCSAYVFHYDGLDWYQQKRLTISDSMTYRSFGNSVSISGDYAIVGGEGGEFVTSGAFMFVRDGNEWIEQMQLIADDGEFIDNFGCSVSISGDYAIVGARTAFDDHDNRSGAAYIFVRDGDNWVQQQKLMASDGAAFEYFGYSVFISGDCAIVGAPIDDFYTGSAYIFVRENTIWTQQDKLIADDRAEYDYFGNSVALSGDYAIVGAEYDDSNGEEAGSAYIFHHDGQDWNQQKKLIATDGKDMYHFGYSVSISGDYAIVGAQLSADSISVTSFHYNDLDWDKEVSYKMIGGGTSITSFGSPVSISDDYLAFGVPYNDDLGENVGCVYIDTMKSSSPPNNVKEQNHNAITKFPDNFVLYKNYPNPFNSTTTVRFGIPKTADVTINVYNIMGEKVADLFQGQKAAGNYSINWDDAHLSSGTYFIHMQSGDFTQTVKCLLIK
jgi:hypothetical protein